MPTVPVVSQLKVLNEKMNLTEVSFILLLVYCLISACTLNYKYKEKLVILQSIGIIVIKVEKQGKSCTSADILVDNLIPIIQSISWIIGI